MLVVNSGGSQLEWGTVALNQSAAVSGALGVANAGTGLTSYTLGDLIYASGSAALAKLAGNTTTTKNTYKNKVTEAPPLPLVGNK